MDWQAAHRNKADDQCKGKVRVRLWEHVLMLYLQYLPTKACEPNASENHCKPVELVMYHPVVLINLKYEHVVDIGVFEDLDCHSCSSQYKDNYKAKIIHLNT